MEYDYYTERLRLHVAQPDEASNILDFHMRNRMYFEPYETKKHSNFYTEVFQYRNLTAESVSFQDGSFIRYYIYKAGCIARAIGTISFKVVTGYDNCSVIQTGYKMDHEEWRKGYAYEALSFIMPRIQLGYGTCRIEALVQPSNTASVCLLKKLGFYTDNGSRTMCEANGRTLPHYIYYLPSAMHQ